MLNFRENIITIRDDFSKFRIYSIQKYLNSLLEIFNKLIELSKKKGELNYKEAILKIINELISMKNKSNQIFKRNIENVKTKEDKNEYKELYKELSHLRNNLVTYLTSFTKKIN